MRFAVLAFAIVLTMSACGENPATSGAGGKSGASGSGGKVGTGGTTRTPASGDCADTSAVTYTINQQYGNGIIKLDNNSSKTYNFQSNWWNNTSPNKYANETETINGLGFALGNPNNASSSDNNPLGFPSIFIGSYQGRTSSGSNLPKQVTALTSVPTIFRINTSGLDTSNFNATYDVWLTQTNALVTGNSPGPGGAYLMVWLYKPSKRQPRGQIALDGHSVDGVDGSWSVWFDNTNPPCVSYVSSSPLSELSFDLNDFIQDAVANQWGVTPTQYLSIIFAGTEVWGGADGFQIKQFCANVQ
jgi:hypothetical protein